MNRRALVFLALVFLFLVLCVYLLQRARNLHGDTVFRLRDCIHSKDTALCAVPATRDMLQTETGAQIMDVLEKNFDPGLCHYFGHVVGQQSYKKYKSVDTAIAQCSEACESA